MPTSGADRHFICKRATRRRAVRSGCSKGSPPRDPLDVLTMAIYDEALCEPLHAAHNRSLPHASTCKAFGRNPMKTVAGLTLAGLTTFAACGGGSGTTPTVPPKVLPQAPTSCTYRVDSPYFDDRVGRFYYDVRWFPPEQQGSDPITSYELTVVRSGLKGSVNSEGVYEIESRRDLPVAKRTVSAKTGTTDDLHTVADAATFPACELLARGEDLGFRAEVRATSAAGTSLPFICVDAHRLWDGLVWGIANDTNGYWRYHCNATGTAPAGSTQDPMNTRPVH